MTILRWALAALFVVASLSACGSNPSSSGGSQGATSNANRSGPSDSGGHTGSGGLWGQIDRDLEGKGSRAAEIERREKEQAAAIAALPIGWKQKIDAWWAVWLLGPADVDAGLKGRRLRDVDPGRLRDARLEMESRWLAARAEWEALGSGAVNILVENLLIYYFRAYDKAIGYEVARTRKELLRHRELVTEYLTTMLGTGAGDSALRRRGAELLAQLGRASIPEIESWLAAKPSANPEAIDGRWALVLALRKMRTPQVLPILSATATNPGEDFRVRLQAIEAIVELRHADGIAPLVTAVRDSDPSVAKWAAGGLATYGEPRPEVLEALVDGLGRWRTEDDNTRTAMLRALRTLSGGRNYGLDAQAWRRWMKSQGVGS